MMYAFLSSSKASIHPSIHLALVLNFLTGAPFEPMQTALLKFVTLKTVFLTLLASGSRCSEVHALSYSGMKFQEKYEYVILEPVAEFKAKTANRDSRSKRSEFIKIPAFSSNIR